MRTVAASVGLSAALVAGFLPGGPFGAETATPQPIQGKILAVQEGAGAKRFVDLSCGSQQGVVPKMIFHVYGSPEVLVLPLTGREVVHLPKEVGTVRVLEVSERACRGEVFGVDDPSLIKPNAVVIGYPVPVRSQLNPNVNALSKRPEASVGGGRLTVTATAQDPDGDPLNYRWISSGGRLSAARTVDPSVVWTLPVAPGEYEVKVVAIDTDRFESATQSLKVAVGPYPEERHRIPFKLLQLVNPAPFFQDVAGLAVDRLNGLYVVDPRSTQVRKVEPDGVTVKYLGEKGSEPGQLREPTRITCQNDFVYVVDKGNCKVVKFPLRGDKYLKEYGEKGEANGQLASPEDVAVSARGDLFIADSETARVLAFDDSGRFLFSLGRRGTAPGSLERPVALALDKGGALYVLDAARQQLICFDRDLRFTGREFKVGAASDVELAPGGDSAYLLFPEEKAIRKLTLADGKFDPAFKVGGAGGGWGTFSAPVALAVNPFGEILVADAGKRTANLQRFGEKGECLAKLGGEDYSEVIRVTPAENGDLFCLSEDGVIRRLSAMGWTVARFGGEGVPGAAKEPLDLVVGPGGFVYLLDGDSLQIRKFTAAGSFVSDFIQVSDAGQLKKVFDEPVALAATSEQVYVLDKGNYRVQILGADGVLKDGIDGSDKKKESYLKGASTIAVEPKSGKIVVGLDTSFKVFGPNRAFLEVWGKSGREDGQFSRIARAAFDGSSDLWVLDSRRSDLQRFRFGAAGNAFQSLVRDDGRAPKPQDLAVTPFNEVWVWDGKNGWAALFAQE